MGELEEVGLCDAQLAVPLVFVVEWLSASPHACEKQPLLWPQSQLAHFCGVHFRWMLWLEPQHVQKSGHEPYL